MNIFLKIAKKRLEDYGFTNVIIDEEKIEITPPKASINNIKIAEDILDASGVDFTKIYKSNGTIKCIF